MFFVHVVVTFNPSSKNNNILLIVSFLIFVIIIVAFQQGNTQYELTIYPLEFA